MSDDPSDVLLEHYRDQLAEERAAKQALERRGQGVIAADAGIVALLFTFGDVTIEWGSNAAGLASALLVLGIVALVASIVGGLIANRPEKYGVSDKLEVIADNDVVWRTADRAAAAQNVALDIAKIVDIAEKRNSAKGEALRCAVHGQVAAVVMLAATVLINAAFV